MRQNIKNSICVAMRRALAGIAELDSKLFDEGEHENVKEFLSEIETQLTVFESTGAFPTHRADAEHIADLETTVKEQGEALDQAEQFVNDKLTTFEKTVTDSLQRIENLVTPKPQP